MGSRKSSKPNNDRHHQLTLHQWPGLERNPKTPPRTHKVLRQSTLTPTGLLQVRARQREQTAGLTGVASWDEGDYDSVEPDHDDDVDDDVFPDFDLLHPSLTEGGDDGGLDPLQDQSGTASAPPSSVTSSPVRRMRSGGDGPGQSQGYGDELPPLSPMPSQPAYLRKSISDLTSMIMRQPYVLEDGLSSSQPAFIPTEMLDSIIGFSPSRRGKTARFSRFDGAHPPSPVLKRSRKERDSNRIVMESQQPVGSETETDVGSDLELLPRPSPRNVQQSGTGESKTIKSAIRKTGKLRPKKKLKFTDLACDNDDIEHTLSSPPCASNQHRQAKKEKDDDRQETLTQLGWTSRTTDFELDHDPISDGTEPESADTKEQKTARPRNIILETQQHYLDSDGDGDDDTDTRDDWLVGLGPPEQKDPSPLNCSATSGGVTRMNIPASAPPVVVLPIMIPDSDDEGDDDMNSESEIGLNIDIDDDITNPGSGGEFSQAQLPVPISPLPSSIPFPSQVGSQLSQFSHIRTRPSDEGSECLLQQERHDRIGQDGVTWQNYPSISVSDLLPSSFSEDIPFPPSQ